MLFRSTEAAAVRAPMPARPGDVGSRGPINPDRRNVNAPPPSRPTPVAPASWGDQLSREAIDAAGVVERAAADADMDRKIEAIYGVQQDGEVAVFRAKGGDVGEMQIAGDFNDWMPHTTPMRRLADGDFEARLKLPRGRYR